MAERFMNKFLDMSSEIWTENRSAQSQIIRDLRDNIDNLKNEVFNAQQDLIAANNQIEQTKGVETDNFNLSEELRAYKEENAQLRQEKQAMQESIDRFKATLSTHGACIENLRKENEKNKKSLNLQTNVSTQLRKQSDALESKNNKLRRALNELASSADDGSSSSLFKRKADKCHDSQAKMPKLATARHTSTVQVHSDNYDDVSADEATGGESDLEVIGYEPGNHSQQGEQ